MSGLRNTYKRIMSFSKGSGYETHGESDIRRGGPKSRMDKIFGGADAPDLEEGRRRSKRKQAARRGSRAETIMTDQLGS